MALNANQLYGNEVTVGPSLRVWPLSARPVEFAAGSGTLPLLRALAYNTSTNKWVPWTTGGANGTGTIRAFVWPKPITLHATDEVLGVVLMAGDVHFKDIPVAGGTEAELIAAIRVPPAGESLRALGIHIKGLALVR